MKAYRGTRQMTEEEIGLEIHSWKKRKPMDPRLRAAWGAYGAQVKASVEKMEASLLAQEQAIAAGRCWVCGRPYVYDEK